ncbi:MAG: sigma-70 family RNA polymerase sigma factor [Desulfobacteraceae bacterium]|nr:sigma-70 family RNA polymerase sigma factor [Desulfobacteraceae bacterium]
MKKPSLEEEQELLRECLGFNRCDKLFQQYWNLVAYTVRKIFKIRGISLDRQNIEDAQHRAFLKIFKNLKKYDKEKSSLTTWITVISTREALSYPKPEESEEFDDHKQEIHIEEKIIDHITIDTAMQKLSQIDKITIKLRIFGLSSKEIAYITDTTPEAVDKRIFDIKKKLKKFI